MQKLDPSHKARLALLEATLKNVPFDGWSETSLKQAVKVTGLPEGADALYFPGGALEMIAFWNEQHDAYVRDAVTKFDLPNMRIRDKITQAVLLRFEAIGDHDEAARRAVARTALLDGLTLSPKILWAAADNIWRAIGDISTDFNFYTKRTTLSAVISTSLAAWLSDRDPNKDKAKAFLDARIENVMQFEKAKFQVKKRMGAMPDPVEILGKIRYGKKRRRSS
ncbi:MAG: COQ9 family protein [Robiginitomaculum sp.]|nr:MAG: COQ9 family protein [Robiginitomaculum sp.]